jgi:hypothetical protein
MILRMTASLALYEEIRWRLGQQGLDEEEIHEQLGIDKGTLHQWRTRGKSSLEGLSKLKAAATKLAADEEEKREQDGRALIDEGLRQLTDGLRRLNVIADSSVRDRRAGGRAEQETSQTEVAPLDRAREALRQVPARNLPALIIGKLADEAPERQRQEFQGRIALLRSQLSALIKETEEAPQATPTEASPPRRLRSRPALLLRQP